MRDETRREQDEPNQPSGVLPKTRHDLVQGVRWFAAEFLVVVCGVLVALALNAWYQGRVDASRESGYLQQLAADLEESEVRLEEALAFNRDERDKLMELLRLFGQDEVPTHEEFDELTTLSFKSADPTLSTAQAVVETGDLHLITDDALRNEIIHYVGAGESYLEEQNAVSWEWLTPSILEYYGLVRIGLGWDHELAISPAEALSQEALYNVAFDLQLGYSNYIRFQERILEDIRQIQSELERVRDPA